MIGTRLGAYEVLAELGSGGMGKVYRAEATRAVAGLEPGCTVALKVIHPHLLESPGFFARFQREARIGHDVCHPNVVRCLDCDTCEVDGLTPHYLVMEYVEGQTLRDLFQDLGIVPEELCRHIGREVAKGLQAIHAAGAIHRDVKPENVLITPAHEVKIMDLGLARLVDEATRLSQTGHFVGSLLYAAPEALRGRDVDGRVDLYGLGLVLYEIATGQHPFRHDDMKVVLRHVLETVPRRAGELSPQLSPFFEEAMATLLQKEVDQRFRSAGDLLDVLSAGEDSPWWKERAAAIRRSTRKPLRRIRIPRETAVYGRDADLAWLDDAYARVRDGAGQVLLIGGEAGIGKTRLVDEFVGRLEREGEDLSILYGSYPPGGAATASGAWSTAYREHFGADGSAAYLPDTPVLVPAFDALLRGEPVPEGSPRLTQDSLQTLFTQATKALAAERPTIVFIEDLHFAPEEGRALFASLALAVSGHPILLIGTARPELPEAWTASLTRLEQVGHRTLERLGPKDLSLLLEDAFHSERLAQELAGKIARKSDGNPFFAFEILRDLRRQGVVARTAEGSWVTTQSLRDIEVPSSVTDLVEARIANLTPEEREIVDVAACLGYEFDPDLVAAVHQGGLLHTLRVLARLGTSHRLVHGFGENFVFDHHQMQEVLYAALPPRLARAYHTAIGEVIEAGHPQPRRDRAVMLVEHCLRGDRAERAKPHLTAALDHLENRYDRERALDLLDRALEVQGVFEGAERAEYLLRRAALLLPVGRLQEGEATLAKAIALAEAAGASALLVRALVRRGTWRLEAARYDEAQADCDRALSLLEDDDTSDETAEALLTSARVAFAQGRMKDAETLAEKALELGRRAACLGTEAAACSVLGTVAVSTGGYRDAVRYLERALEIARALPDQDREANVLNRLGATAIRSGDNLKGRELFEMALDVARVCSNRFEESTAITNLAEVNLWYGAFEEAAEYAELAISLAQQAGDVWGQVEALGVFGNTLLAQGRYADAERHQARRVRIVEEGDLSSLRLQTIHDVGCLRLYLGDLDAATQSFEELGARARESDSPFFESFADWGLYQVYWQRGEIEAALRQADQCVERRLALAYKDGAAESLMDRGELEGLLGQREKAQASLEEGLALAREIEAPNYIALTMVRLAGIKRDAGMGRQALGEYASRMWTYFRMDAWLRIWQLTQDPHDLEEAHRDHAHILEHAPPSSRPAMLENLRVHRSIEQAWTERAARTVPGEDT